MFAPRPWFPFVCQYKCWQSFLPQHGWIDLLRCCTVGCSTVGCSTAGCYKPSATKSLRRVEPRNTSVWRNVNVHEHFVLVSLFEFAGPSVPSCVFSNGVKTLCWILLSNFQHLTTQSCWLVVDTSFYISCSVRTINVNQDGWCGSTRTESANRKSAPLFPSQYLLLQYLINSQRGNAAGIHLV